MSFEIEHKTTYSGEPKVGFEKPVNDQDFEWK